MISPDTLQDEVKRDVYYYRVYIRTDSNHLTNRQGKEFPVFPGMIATVDIKTGSKSVIDYLLKPLNKAKRRCASDKKGVQQAERPSDQSVDVMLTAWRRSLAPH